ncbi:hypothetical protein NPX79_03470 [Spiroplasma endosymbiont of Anurida maritima]|uniref:hypothetical protein n=1 Tax=Spiroplasma endosymbiont of Anurida maritima TaxID=2967972 RepID=UPI0036D33C7F
MKKKINKIKIGNINDLLEDESQYNGDYKLSKSASRLFDKINNEKQISDLEFEEKNLSADEELADEPLKELGVNFKTFNKLQKVKPIRNPLTWVAKSTSNDIDDEEIVLTVDPSKYDGLKKKNIDLKQNDYNVAENNDFIFADEPDLSQEFDIEKRN